MGSNRWREIGVWALVTTVVVVGLFAVVPTSAVDQAVGVVPSAPNPTAPDGAKPLVVDLGTCSVTAELRAGPWPEVGILELTARRASANVGRAQIPVTVVRREMNPLSRVIAAGDTKPVWQQVVQAAFDSSDTWHQKIEVPYGSAVSRPAPGIATRPRAGIVVSYVVLIGPDGKQRQAASYTQ